MERHYARQQRTLQAKRAKTRNGFIANSRAMPASFHALFACLRSIPEVAAICSAAFEGQPFSVRFCPEEEIGAEADCDPDERLIRIRTGEDDFGAIESLLFELCNGANRPLADIVASNYSDADAFANAVEREEFESAKMLRNLCSSLTGSNAFVRMLAETLKQTHEQIRDKIEEMKKLFEFDSFEAYIKTQNDEGHTDFYRRQYKAFEDAKVTIYI
jgi:hypothetical protein